MTDYVTVVSVDNGVGKLLKVDQQQLHIQSNIGDDSEDTKISLSGDSPYITVLSINETEIQSINSMSTINTATSADNLPETVKLTTQPNALAVAEKVIVYRLPGERLGFGLKFQGGTRNAENIHKLFIQSCTADSPASRASTSWGNLREGDEIVEIDGIDVREMTRLECVQCLKESQLAIRLLVRNGEGMAYQQLVNENAAGQSSIVGNANQKPPSPPPVPPRKINKRKSLNDKIEQSSIAKHHSIEKSFTPPPDAEFYINLFSGNFCYNINRIF